MWERLYSLVFALKLEWREFEVFWVGDRLDEEVDEELDIDEEDIESVVGNISDVEASMGLGTLCPVLIWDCNLLLIIVLFAKSFYWKNTFKIRKVS